MTNILDTINPIKIGGKLRKIREHEGFVPNSIAESLGIDTDDLAAIETGKRRIKAGELIKLSDLYNRDIRIFTNDCLDVSDIDVSISVPGLSNKQENKLNKSIELLKQLSINHLELCELIDDKHFPASSPVNFFCIDLGLSNIIAIYFHNEMLGFCVGISYDLESKHMSSVLSMLYDKHDNSGYISADEILTECDAKCPFIDVDSGLKLPEQYIRYLSLLRENGDLSEAEVAHYLNADRLTARGVMNSYDDSVQNIANPF